ncbi:chromate transporter [Carnobacterium sp. ISL-102]|uniref:chromate transporter n=1 Tax=Carnobacterium sp. ISL-102 TaxID=2819142 RepID=UPI001BEA989D|nr:chromate transporter [Carnobacterium sp. ISL-102]MBT2732050.1 chromate transporter [Carnobacterium sp. ISL-102]
MIYLQLFWSFFQVGALSFGGGYAALPLIQEQVIEKNDWLTNTEYIDVLTISQMTPGPIALNASTFVGTKVAGIPGSIFATLGCITPSVIIVLVLAVFYYKYKGLSLVQGVIKGLRPAVVALIGSAGLSILLTALFNKDTLPIEWAKLDLVSLVLFIVGLVLLRKTKINPIYVMLAAGLARLIIYGAATL